MRKERLVKKRNHPHLQFHFLEEGSEIGREREKKKKEKGGNWKNLREKEARGVVIFV